MFCRVRQRVVALTIASLFLGCVSSAQTQVPPAPAAYLWQNDPGVLSAYGLNTVSPFCLPAAIGTGILMQWFGPNLNQTLRAHSKLRGITHQNGKIEINTTDVLLDWIQRCGAGNGGGSKVVDGPQCIASFYREMGLTQFDVKFYRAFSDVLDLGEARHLQRKPAPEDIINDLRDGYSVVASIAFASTVDSSGLLKRSKSHALLILGMVPISANEYRVWVTNPTRGYDPQRGEPLMDEVKLVRVADPIAQRLESTLTLWEWKGRLMARPNSLSLLHALTSFRPY